MIFLILFIATVVYGFIKLDRAETGTPVRVALVQGI
jgi:hypothetical protein